MNKIVKLMIAITLAIFSTSVLANPIAGDTCGSPDRIATVSDAAQCAYGPGNPDATDITSYYGDTWINAGELTADGTNGFLSATSDVGWGVIPNSGTWSIDAGFWDVYTHAVITMHVGDGAGDPDHWAWLMVDGDIGGTVDDIWSLGYLPDGTNQGGGLSNIKLWGAAGTAVPEPGMVALLAIGLLGMVVARRRMKL